MLKTYIEDSSGPAPIAYFELMRLYDHADDAAGPAAVRRRYLQVFGAEPPALEQIAAPHGLQARAELAARITRNWGKPQALDMIEDLLFAAPAPDKALSLEAGRDLLCLFRWGPSCSAKRPPRRAARATNMAGAPGARRRRRAGPVAAQDAADYGVGLDLDRTRMPRRCRSRSRWNARTPSRCGCRSRKTIRCWRNSRRRSAANLPAAAATRTRTARTSTPSVTRWPTRAAAPCPVEKRTRHGPWCSKDPPAPTPRPW
ncbi:hypothetical protein HK414_11520 [Ramlibacter terrae]|uniref:Uncharacterized protein n=1 Tax=Ramlibacter terrae TaxID=2732511 RepID=A0ABX6P295_9BURK|nr:hypothetical protein HK414_11520 [Ramlibacter terrae]